MKPCGKRSKLGLSIWKVHSMYCPGTQDCPWYQEHFFSSQRHFNSVFGAVGAVLTTTLVRCLKYRPKTGLVKHLRCVLILFHGQEEAKRGKNQ